jgi:Dyp-type peroxidase family
MVQLDLADIQGNILVGYGFPAGRHQFFHVPTAEAGRRFLSRILEEVTVQNAQPWTKKPRVAANVALTYAGLEALGVQDAVLAQLPAAFREPTRQRAERVLGDRARNAPCHWDLDASESHILVLLAVSDITETKPDEAAENVRGIASACGVEPGPCQPVQALPNRREHFGWADGFGQPAVEGVPPGHRGRRRARAGQGVPEPNGITWRDLKAGEFVLGYPDEDGPGTLGGPAAPLLRNGSYLVYRKLYQDVPGFHRLLREQARRYGATLPAEAPRDIDHLCEVLAAKLAGRWRDGVAVPLRERRRVEDTKRLADSASRNPDNNFRYAALDPHGRICPIGAHIRRTNPRDALVGGGALSRRHRIIRRGMPYGAQWDGSEQDSADRGLIFVCFNADIERQFEFVQTQWVNDGNAFGLGDDRDVFAGLDGGSPKLVIQGDVPFLMKRDQVVFTRGCEYLLMPGIDALRDIVATRPGLVGP